MCVMIADLCVHGVRESQTKRLFDIRVVDTHVWSCRTCCPCDAESFVKRLGDFLIARWERPYSVVRGIGRGVSRGFNKLLKFLDKPIKPKT